MSEKFSNSKLIKCYDYINSEFPQLHTTLRGNSYITIEVGSLIDDCPVATHDLNDQNYDVGIHKRLSNAIDTFSCEAHIEYNGVVKIVEVK